jgi:hypothetical protein
MGSFGQGSCEWCGVSFQLARRAQRFCMPEHRMHYHNRRIKRALLGLGGHPEIKDVGDGGRDSLEPPKNAPEKIIQEKKE